MTGLDEYWLYKFKVNAATVKGNATSEFSSVFRTKQGGESFCYVEMKSGVAVAMPLVSVS